ncbi:unnamed protein product [Caenorhabditis brenneri]
MGRPWGSHPEDAGLLQFLLEKAKEVNPSSSKMRPFADEYQRKTGKCPFDSAFFVSRLVELIQTARNHRDLIEIDRETQVKVLFLMSVCLNKKLLKKLRLDAHIEVDEENRITKYRSNDGNLNLKGDHKPTRARIREESLAKLSKLMKRSAPEVMNNSSKRSRFDIPQNIVIRYPENYHFPWVNHPKTSELLNHDPGCQNSQLGAQRASEPCQEPSPNPRIHGSMDPIPKNPGSTKRAAPEVPVKSEDSEAPDDSAGAPQSGAGEPEIQQLRQPKLEAPEAPDFRIGGALGAPEPLGSSAPTPEPKNPGSTKRAAPEVPAPDDSARIPNPGIQQLRQPKLEVPDDPNLRIGGAIGAPEPPGSSAPAPEPSRPRPPQYDGYTHQIKFLSMIQSLVHTLDRPNLSLLQTRISRKIRESSAWIPNEEISLALELLVAKITNHSVPMDFNVDSISVKEFLCYLKAVIVNSELEGLEVLMEKINARIREPVLKEKSIPMVRLAGLLQTALNNAGV